jgi:hypothetical protein
MFSTQRFPSAAFSFLPKHCSGVWTRVAMNNKAYQQLSKYDRSDI